MAKKKQKNKYRDDRWIRKMAKSDVRLDIRLTNDFAFKKTFHNVKALKGLLSALLKIEVGEIQKIEFMDTFLKGEYPDEKEGILDIRVHLNGNRKINIEMQVNFFPYWKERSLFYLGKMYVDGFSKGENYGELEECIHIGILQFELEENYPLHSRFELWDMENQTKYSDKISIHVLELSKLEKATEEEKKTDIYKWAKLISADDWEVLNMLAKENEYMQAAKEEMEKINSDEAMRYAYLKEEMRIADEVTVRNYYESKGKKLGESIGEKRGKRIGEKIGEKRGEKRGEERFGKLCTRLIKDGQTEDIGRAASDAKYRSSLYKQYNL